MTTWTTVESDTVVFGSPPNSLRVGYSVDLNLWSSTANIQNVASTLPWGETSYIFSDDTAGASLYFVKSRAATFGSHGIVHDGDALGDILFGGDDGVTYNNASAAIIAYADGTPGVGDVPGRLSFQVAPAGGASGAFALVEALSVNSDKTSDFSGTVNIAPAEGSLGINISQTGSTATVSADKNYNNILVVGDATTAPPGVETHGLGVQLISGGPTAVGEKIAIRGLATLSGATTASAGDFIGVSGLAISGQTNGGTDTGAGAAGTLYGGSFVGNAFSGALNYSVISGAEFDAIINTGATAKHRWAVSVAGNGNVRGVSSDAAIEIGSVNTSGSHTFGILFDNFHGAAPLPTTGTVLGTDGSSVTVTNFADFHTYTFTGDILYFPTFRVTGAGDLSANSLLTATVTVANLPAASSGNKGMRMMVSNATATTFWSIVAGSGANIVPVTSDGTNWRIG